MSNSFMDTNSCNALWGMVVDYMFENRSSDGSFKTMYLQPYYHPSEGWMKYPVNSNFCSASVAVNLLHAKEEPKIAELLKSSVQFLLSNSFRGKLWSFGAIDKKYRVPNDSDTTSMSSFFLGSMGIKIPNRKILMRQKENGVFKLWISDQYLSIYSFADYISILYYNKMVKKCKPLQNKHIDLDDHEVIVDCNNLLYLGLKDNQDVFEKVSKQVLNNLKETTYYTTYVQEVYHICRLHYYDIVNLKKENRLYDTIIERLYDFYNSSYRKDNLLDDLYFLISLLYLEERAFIQEIDTDKFIEESYKRKLYETVEPFYTSNNKLDINPKTKEPATFFGSDIYTSSLYIEFLSLYKG
ncbi:hypothetical protein GCM10009118_32760 [Wandonia haliotis]|uniref:Uncharacterized protein n=1 Tax=Wandonia haliotis TaxID=574963 RepID=A0ABP3Y5X7_9FLAO